MTEFMNTQTCLLCSEEYQTKDLRTELCPSCKKVHEKEVSRFRGTGGAGNLPPHTKQRILDSKTLRFGTGHRYDYFDKKGQA